MSRIIAALLFPPLESVVLDARTGRVFAVSNRSVRMLDARTGDQLASVAVGGLALEYTVGVPQVDERRGQVYVLVSSPRDRTHETLTGPGHVYILDAATGALLRTVPVGLVDSAEGQLLAVDQDSGLVFCVNNASGSLSVIDPSRPSRGRPLTRRASPSCPGSPVPGRADCPWRA